MYYVHTFHRIEEPYEHNVSIPLYCLWREREGVLFKTYQVIRQYIRLANDANSHQLEKLPLRLQEAEGKGQCRLLQHVLYDRIL